MLSPTVKVYTGNSGAPRSTICLARVMEKRPDKRDS